MDLRLSENEVRAIQVWADSAIHGGHWGDGDLEIPEESIILKKLENIENQTVTITEQEAKILLLWSRSTLGIHTIEEEQVIRKLKKLLPQEEWENVYPDSGD
jgi:hypothetical protein